MKKSKSFLIADPDKHGVDLFASLLKEFSPDAVVHTVSDGAQAVEWLDSCQPSALPDAIIMDYSMPNMNGAEVLDHICRKPRYHLLAKFILSAVSDKEYMDGCLHKGAIEYFIKPEETTGLRSIASRITRYVKAIS